jgi:ribonuclease HI
MELAAIYYALRYIPTGVNQISVFTDSSYCYNTLTKWGRDWKIGNWRTATGSDVKNKELISELLDVLDLHLTHREVKFILVKGHSGIEDNEDVDKAAKKARVESVTNWTKKNEGVLHTKRVEERTGSGEKSSSCNGSRNRYKATQSR